eukprot:TRINITY_DN5980_c0_g1_i1.p1 TRINITY_DN5980_c0_g1~~TRINITY_DN5980_c0_g1_i1.p1  ORF type:complete len:1281 (+),score=197.77 TRINITY_DN5980_c0_g1_i1:45-3887(+)
MGAPQSFKGQRGKGYGSNPKGSQTGKFGRGGHQYEPSYYDDEKSMMQFTQNDYAKGGKFTGHSSYGKGGKYNSHGSPTYPSSPILSMKGKGSGRGAFQYDTNLYPTQTYSATYNHQDHQTRNTRGGYNHNEYPSSRGKGAKGSTPNYHPHTHHNLPQPQYSGQHATRGQQAGRGKSGRGGRGGGGGNVGKRGNIHPAPSSRKDLHSAFDILEAFLASTETTMEFPSTLTPYERSEVHGRCHVLGLLSKSSGPESCRVLRISKKEKLSDANERTDLPSITVDPFTKEGDFKILERYEKSGFMKAADTMVMRSNFKVIDKKRRRMFTYTEAFKSGPTKFTRAKVDPEIKNFVSALPMRRQQQQLQKLLGQTDVIVLSGETGSGKSTQAPQIILDSGLIKGGIICTQPRRISAVTVAERVAAERGVPIGSEVGFQVRFEGKRSPDTRLMFVTTGILFNLIRDNPTLPGIGCVIIDEVHERDADMDFSLLILRNVLRQKSSQLPLKVILMSATLSKEIFINYFKEFSPRSVAVEGRTFPVKQHFLEDTMRICRINATDTAHENSSDLLGRTSLSPERQQALSNVMREMDIQIDYALIMRLLTMIHQNNKPHEAVLVFLPGWNSIITLDEELRRSPVSRGLQILKCHSSVPSNEQQAIFRPPPRGLRKVVLSTNIAETSVTVPDVVFVIDTALHKQFSYSGESDVARLDSCVVSKSNISQRKGRAGRTQPGVCYTLISRSKFSELPDFMKPELLRSPLETLFLQVKSLKIDSAMGISVSDVLNQCPDPPPQASISNAKVYLHNCGALDHGENLTYLGQVLASLPVPPLVGKLLLYGVAFKVAKPIIIISAAISGKKPYVRTSGGGSTEKITSDHIRILELYTAWKSISSGSQQVSFCQSNDLSQACMNMIDRTASQLTRLVSDCGFIAKDKFDEYNKFGESTGLVRAVLFAGLWPNVVHVSPVVSHKTQKIIKGQIAIFTPGGKDCHLGRDSSCSEKLAVDQKLEIGVYFEKLYVNGKLSISDISFYSAIPALIFCRELHWGSPDPSNPSMTPATLEDFRTVQVPTASVSVIKGLRNLLIFFFQKSLERVDASVLPEDLIVLFSRVVGYDLSQKEEESFIEPQYEWSTDAESEADDDYEEPEIVEADELVEDPVSEVDDNAPNKSDDDDCSSSESSGYHEDISHTPVPQKKQDLSFLDTKPEDAEKFSFLSPISPGKSKSFSPQPVPIAPQKPEIKNEDEDEEDEDYEPPPYPLPEGYLKQIQEYDPTDYPEFQDLPPQTSSTAE